MNANDLLTKTDLDSFEKKIINIISEKIESLRTDSFSKNNDRLLGRLELIEFLGVSENTFKELQKNGLPYTRVGKRARYDKNEVFAFLKNGNSI